MEGYLDYLETAGPLGFHKKFWVRRFCKLNAAFHVLEIFADDTQYERRRKLELRGATVSTADELGGLLNDDKVAAEMSRRFIFRLTENGKKHHYFCSELNGIVSPTSTAYEMASRTRNYMEKWLHALRTTISAKEETSCSVDPMGGGNLNAQIAISMNHMHLSARISNCVRDKGRTMFEITVKAWILNRELVDEGQSQYGNYVDNFQGGSDVSWQILEYSCAWKMMKSTADLRNFDGQLRQFIGSSMVKHAFPSSLIGDTLQHFHLHASATKKEAETHQRMQIYDTYLQSLLLLPELSLFGSDASKMFDAFYDISPHLVSFRKLEKKNRLRMHLRDRKVVPWQDRERFEVVYKMHLRVSATQGENARRVLTDQTVSRHKKSTTSHHHHRSRQNYREMSNSLADTEARDSNNLAFKKFSAASLPPPVLAAEESRPVEAIHDKIARIGHRLIIEAFET